jgi:hypothetical protein
MSCPDMNSLLQKFLADAESADLPEGQFLTVANALKDVFKKVETPEKRVKLNYVIIAPSFTLDVTHKNISNSNDISFDMVLLLRSGTEIKKTTKMCDINHIVTYLLDEYHDKEIRIQKNSILTTLKYTPSITETTNDILESDGGHSPISGFANFVAHVEEVLSYY